MEKIYLSDSGPKVSPAIYGFWRWTEKQAADTHSLERIVNLCLDLGINTFDHADVYGDYCAEATFGRLISQKAINRQSLVLFTKCGQCVPGAHRPAYRVRHTNTSAAHIVASVEASLKNLNTDYLDIFLLDGLDPLSPIEETALALEKLRSSGKVKNIGVANFTVFQHQLLASLLRVPIVTNHIRLNLLNTEALDNGQIDYIKQRFMRPIAAEPLADGRIENGTDPHATRVREQLQNLANQYQVGIESLAVAWLCKLGALPLIGTLSETRIRNIAAGLSIQLDHQDWYALYQASKSSNEE
ncbi:MAG TPA: aldo/keto reductase [Phnomibacter sp.]|nr:aldo/keto reductase [Phnomibacter sp.]